MTNSSFVRGWRFDEHLKTVEIVLGSENNSSVYVYFEVTKSVVSALRRATLNEGSVGQVYNTYLKGNFWPTPADLERWDAAVENSRRLKPSAPAPRCKIERYDDGYGWWDRAGEVWGDIGGRVGP